MWDKAKDVGGKSSIKAKQKPQNARRIPAALDEKHTVHLSNPDDTDSLAKDENAKVDIEGLSDIEQRKS